MSKSELWLGVKYSEMNKQQKRIYWNMCKKESRKRHPEIIKESNRKYREKQKQNVADLETKLADKDKAIENWETMYKSVVQTCHNDKEEIERLNKQLAEKDDEITQRLVIQESDYNQDKISFAVEQLEKVKEYIKTNLMSFQKVPIIQEIDNQIKQLKEMK